MPSTFASVHVLVDTGGLSLVDTELLYRHKRTQPYLSQLGFAPECDHVGSGAALQARNLHFSRGPNTHDEAAQASALRQLALQPQVIYVGHSPAIFGRPRLFLEDSL